jgi:hypothetical protein
MTLEYLLDPMEEILPGQWRLSFPDAVNESGTGWYQFKIAGTFDAQVVDALAGQATLHGYWQVVDAKLILKGQEVSPTCTSCLDAGNGIHWVIELEQVGTQNFSGQIMGLAEQPTALYGVFTRA